MSLILIFPPKKNTHVCRLDKHNKILIDTYANRFSNIWHLSCARKHKALGYTIIVIPTKHVASPCGHSVFCDTLPNRHACVRVFLARSFVNGKFISFLIMNALKLYYPENEILTELVNVM